MSDTPDSQTPQPPTPGDQQPSAQPPAPEARPAEPQAAAPENNPLDQGDIEKLLAEVETQKAETVFDHTGRRFGKDVKLNIENYDFRNPVFLTEYDLRQVRIRQEQFVHYLAARMAMFLRMDFGLKMVKLQTLDFTKYTTALPSPVAISLFKVEQLNGVGILSINPRLAMTIVDRMLGGKGHSVREDRYLTEIEISLLNDVVHTFLEEWCRQWADIQEMTTAIVGNENNGRFLQTAASDAPMLVLVMEGDLGDCAEEISLAVPYYMIEPLVKKIQANSKKYAKSQEAEKGIQWMDSCSSIKMPLFAEWTSFEMTVRDLLALREGDVMELPSTILGQAQVRVVNSPKFRGEIGLEGDKVAVKLTEKMGAI
jgi:flagellar motor switch protein FliM